MGTFLRTARFKLLLMCATPIVVGIPLILLPTSSPAATITVNDTSDANGSVSTGKCTLREAIIAANTDTPVDGCPAGSGDDTIILPAGTYTLSIAGAEENAAQTGDLDITGNLTLAGAGKESTIIDGGGIDRVLHVDPACAGIVVNISGITVRNGAAPDSADSNEVNGGGIFNCGTLILSDSVITGNKASNVGLGGGIFNKGTLSGRSVAVNANTQAFMGGGIYNAGTLMFTNSTIDGNATAYANSSGGGIGNEGTASLFDVTVSNNTARGSGGGITNGGSGYLRLVDSTVSGNTALNDYGGGIANQSVLDVTNSTISGNSARTTGGGVWNNNLMSMANVTVANNQVSIGPGGGIYLYNPGILDIENTLLANNIAAAVKNNCSAPTGSLTSYGYNLEDADTCGLTAPGDRTNVNPLLGPLQNNGGMTLTHALLAGSPAIDAGNPAGCTAEGGTRALLNDQRSYTRPVDGNGDGTATCDVGAYEYGGVPGTGSDLRIQKWGSPNPVAVDGSLTYTIVVTNNGPGIAGGVVVTDSLPPNVTWLSTSIDAGVCMGSNPFKCYIGTLFDAESAMLSFVVKPTFAGAISNTATVTSDTPDPSTANNSATATTTCANPVQRIEGGTAVGSYPTLQAAFNAALSGDTIEAQATTFNENPVFSSGVPVTVKGGFDLSFSAQTGYSTVAGTVTVAAGTMAVENLIIR